jgi:hypothetical protein
VGAHLLISARVALDPDGGLGGAGERVARTFERIVTTLRLYKAGGVGLAPHGWVRVAGDRWRRIATGAGRPRPGGYRLTESDAPRLADLSRAVDVHPQRVKRLRRAILRFEAGLDRRGAIDALNDHLLALRFLLEGEGPAGVGLPMRVAALAETAGERIDAKGAVEQAVALEREIWSGEPAAAGRGASDVAAQVEELLRTILRRGVVGELGNDFRAAADEALLAEGLAFGEGDAAERGGTTEWDLPLATDVESGEVAEEEPEMHDGDFEDEGLPEPIPAAAGEPEDFEIPDAERIVVRAARAEATEPDEPIAEETQPFAFVEEDGTIVEEPEPEAGSEPEIADWLEEVDAEATMDFPARSNHLEDLARPPMDREEVKARVEYLFPRTETNWAVGTRSPRRAAS